jgi:hypothetical protein
MPAPLLARRLPAASLYSFQPELKPCLIADKSTALHQRLAWQTVLIAAAASRRGVRTEQAHPKGSSIVRPRLPTT